MEVEYAVAPNGGAEATKGEGQDPPEDVLPKSPPIPSIVDDDAAEGPSGSPVFTFLGAPTDTTPVARLIPGASAGLEDLCKHESMEVGTIFEETGDQRLAPPLEPMPEGRVAKVFREVSVQNAHAGTTTTYRTDDFVYVATRDTAMPPHVCKIDHFLSWDNVEGKECKAVLLKRYLRADSPGASGAVLGATNASPERLPLEVYETSWHSIRRVEDVLGHASVVLGAGNVSTTPSSSDSHVCRYSYDHLSGRLEPLQGARVVEDEAAENNETVMALELMGAAVEAEAEDHSEAGESDAIIEEDEPSAPAGPAQLVAAENQGSVKRRKVAEPADLQNSVQPQNHPSGVLTFPLKLSTASLRSRWTQQRYENGQKFLFVALMDKKAFSRENAINRQALRQAVQTRGIGDLGLVDHIIKTLTEVPVLFSGYWIRKQHSHKGVLHYWLSQEVPGVNTVGLNQQQNEGLQIGQRIEVHFDDPPDYFPGTITGKDKGRWQIEYDDGDREELDLSTTKYRLLRGEGLIAGPKAHKAAKPTKRKGTRPTRRGLTLLDLMKKGLMEPGQGVLRVEYKGHVFLGDLTPSGSICYEGELWESPTSWSMHVKRRVSPGMKVDNGWESVFYVAKDGGEIITLKQLRSTHALKMVGSGSFEKETATAPKVKPALAA